MNPHGFSPGRELPFGPSAGMPNRMSLSSGRVETNGTPSRGGFVLLENLVSTGVVLVMFLALFSAISQSFASMERGRQNVRATQIMVERLEGIRLYTYDQLTMSNMFSPTFTERYCPEGVGSNRGGVTYYGEIRISDAGFGTSYGTNMSSVVVSLAWTNQSGVRPVVHRRQMQTLVGRYGVQNYMFYN